LSRFLREDDLQHCMRSSLKTGPAWPGHVKIVLDITAVDIDLFFSFLVHCQIVVRRGGELTGKEQAAKHPTDKSCYCSDNISINILKLHCHNESRYHCS